MDSTKTRREFLKKAGKVTAAAGALGFGWSTAHASTGDSVRTTDVPSMNVTPATAPLPENGLLHGIGTGKIFSGDWQITNIYGPVAGGLTLVLQGGGGKRPLRVDLCLQGDVTRAPVSTQYLELFVMDGGGGEGCIDESLFEALEVLGQTIRRNESDVRLLEGILTFDERWDLYPDFMACAASELEPGVEPRKKKSR